MKGGGRWSTYPLRRLDDTETLRRIDTMAKEILSSRELNRAAWSRVHGFARDHLTRSIDRREVVRATLMRCTLHLFSAKDYRRLRPSLQPALDRAMKSALRARGVGHTRPGSFNPDRRGVSTRYNSTRPARASLPDQDRSCRNAFKHLSHPRTCDNRGDRPVFVGDPCRSRL